MINSDEILRRNGNNNGDNFRIDLYELRQYILYLHIQWKTATNCYICTLLRFNIQCQKCYINCALQPQGTNTGPNG